MQDREAGVGQGGRKLVSLADVPRSSGATPASPSGGEGFSSRTRVTGRQAAMCPPLSQINRPRG